MPTKLRRIAVTVDSRLAAAIEDARREQPGKSEAALLKELALRGATGSVGSGSAALERILSRPGVRLPQRRLDTVLSRLGPRASLDPAKLKEALEEERSERDMP